MSKILISFLGTGPIKNNSNDATQNSSEREYKTAKYHFKDGTEKENTFVAAALAEHSKVDKIILIGTVHSMREEVYRYFTEKKNKSIDEKVYYEIYDHSEKANHSSELYIPHKECIEQSIGDKAKIILIKYGITDEEIKENINTVLKLEEEMSENDELIVDITHSFRSLPIILMNLLIYLQSVSRKKINISHIYYGMVEVVREIKYAPVTELNNLLDINKWIIGAYAFENFGNAYQIADLIEDENKSVSERLRRFSDLMNLNHLGLLQKEVDNLKAIKNVQYKSLIPSLIITPIVDSFIKSFGNIKSHALFQLRLANWQYKHHNYATAYISLMESIITYVCESNGKLWEDKAIRDEAKKELGRNNSIWSIDAQLTKIFKDTRKIRNSLAHSIETDKNHTTMIKVLEDNLKIAATTIK